MRFSEKAYAYGLKDKGLFPTVPASEDDAREQFQSMFNQILKLLNELVGELENVKTGESGAERIGSAQIGEVNGLTVREQIEDLKKQIDAKTLGQIPDGSLIDSKLSTDIKIGSLAALTTAAKSSLQEAVNELDREIGDLSLLTTAEKSTLVGAINQFNDVPVTESKIIDGAVTETKIGVGAVTPLKLHANITAMIPSMSTGAAISASTDLNTYTNAGTYIATGTVPASLLNCPITQAFKLFVNHPTNASGVIVQTIVQYNGIKFERYSENSGTSWSTWTAQPYIVYGTGATPPAGNYPAGTIYIQYV